MESIREISRSLIKRWQRKNKEKKREKRILCDALTEVLSKKEKKHIVDFYLDSKFKQFIIKIDSSAWLYTINLKKTEILNRLNQVLDSQSQVDSVKLYLKAELEKRKNAI